MNKTGPENWFYFSMAESRNKRKQAAVNRDNQEEYPRNNISRETVIPEINEEYITQVSEELEGRVTENNSSESNTIENRIVGEL